MNPKVSIVIPVYNAENTVRRTVESLIYGEEKEIEIILVEDCSKDKSWKVCKELHTEFQNVHCVKNDKNSGVSYTRNHGIREATAPYIMFVDSDDWVSTKYVSKMMDLVTKYENMLPICGFHFWDYVSDTKNDYIWDEKDKKELFEIDGVTLFDAVDRIMLQNLWNKIFKRKILETNHIFFNEAQSMGEDFEFVLDYMLAANIKKCVVLNKALYYYTRMNRTSLMSDFGWKSDNTYQRMRTLAQICGDKDENIQQRLDVQISKAKENSIYCVIRTANRSRKDKIERIRQITESHKGAYYWKYIESYYKEQLKKKWYDFKKIKSWLSGRIQRRQRTLLIEREKEKLVQRDISVISQNCIGGVFYHDMGLPFLSPTINLYFKEPDFIKLALNLKYYMECSLNMRWEEEYPVGILGDVTIYFMHYSSCKEAKEAWNRRKERINYDRVLVLATDRNGFTETTYQQWEKIPYKKILFSTKKKYSSNDTVVYSEYESQEYVPDLIPNRAFYKDGILIKIVNSMN